MGIFGSTSLNETKGPSAGGYYFDVGEYEFEVTAVKKVPTRGKGPMFLVETLVLESTNDERPAGSRPSWCQMIEGKAADVAPQNIKMFFTAIAGLDIYEQKDAKAIAAFDWDSFGSSAITEDNPLKGCRVHLEVFPKAAGKNYNKTKFTPSKDLNELQKKMLATARKAVSK